MQGSSSFLDSRYFLSLILFSEYKHLYGKPLTYQVKSTKVTVCSLNDRHVYIERFRSTLCPYQHRVSASLKQPPPFFFCISTSFFGVAEPIILIRVTSILKISHMKPGTINPCYFLPSQIPCYRFTSNSKQSLPSPCFPISKSKFQRTLASSGRPLHATSTKIY